MFQDCTVNHADDIATWSDVSSHLLNSASISVKSDFFIESVHVLVLLVCMIWDVHCPYGQIEETMLETNVLTFYKNLVTFYFYDQILLTRFVNVIKNASLHHASTLCDYRTCGRCLEVQGLTKNMRWNTVVAYSLSLSQQFQKIDREHLVQSKMIN